MRKHLLPIVIASMLITSCATIFTGTKDRISFNTTPVGAIIYKDGVEQCKTPCSFKVKRELNDTDIEIKLDGYETRLITLDKEFNLVSILNLGSLLGWGIDAISGSLMKYDRKAYDLTLSKNNITSLIKPAKIYIDTKKNVVDVYVIK